MAAQASTTDLPPILCDTLLRLVPLNILLFDTDLVCRYAAPLDDQLLGRPREELMGRPAWEVLPPAGNGLRPMLERAARQTEAWRDPEYRFSRLIDDVETPCCWSIQVEPVAVDDYRGVLVAWSDVLESFAERDALAADVERLRTDARARTAETFALLSEMRGILTPISGYLQAIVRRPRVLAGMSVHAIVAERLLPGVQQLVASIDRLARAQRADVTHGRT